MRRYTQKYSNVYCKRKNAYQLKKHLAPELASAFNMTNERAQQIVDFVLGKIFYSIKNGIQVRFADMFALYLQPYRPIWLPYRGKGETQMNEHLRPEHWGLHVYLTKPGFRQINESMGPPLDSDFRHIERVYNRETGQIIERRG